MKWYSIKKHRPPRKVICLVFTVCNYLYLATLNDSEDFSIWTNNSDEKDDVIHDVTHFCIPGPVKLD